MANRYWVGGAGTWNTSSTTNWSTSPGGSSGASVPTSSDSVFFDSDSGTPGTITCTGALNCLDFTTSVSGWTITQTSATISVYGNFTLDSGTTWSLNNQLNFPGSTTQTVITNGVTITGSIVASGSGTFKLSSAITCSGSYTSSGTKSSDFGSTTATFSSVTLGATSATVGFGSVGLVLTGSGTCFSETVSRTSSSYYTTSVISATSSSPKTMSFYPTNSYVGINQGGTGALTLTTSTGTGDIYLSGTTLKNSVQPATISITGGLTIRGIGTLQLNGTAGNLVTLGSTNTTPVTLESYDVGVQTASYCSVSYITGSNAAALGGTGVLWRFLNSTNGGNNTNLTFASLYYWVGGSGTWNNSSTTNWSLTSGGSGGAGVPTAADDVIFNSASNATSYIVSNASAIASCFNLTIGAPASGSVSINPAFLYIYGNFTATSSSNISVASQIYYSNSVPATLTPNGVTFGIFNNLGTAILTLGGAFVVTVELAGGGGGINTSTSNYSITTPRLDTGEFGAGTFTFNASTITITGYNSTSIYTLRIGSSCTVNAGTSTINVTGANTGTYLFQFGGKTYNNVTLNNGNYNGVTYNITDTVTNTFNTFTYNGSSAAPSLNSLVLSGNIQYGNLYLNYAVAATYNNRLFVRSDTIGTQRTFTSTSYSLTAAYTDYRDITTTGTQPDIGTFNNGDCGGNSNITFPTPKAVYWNLAGTQNWSANGWSTSSGGTPAVANFPLAQDIVNFDNTGAAGTVTIDKNWNIGEFNMSNRTSAMTLATGTTTPTIYGSSWYYGTGVTTTGTGAITVSRATRTNYVYLWPNGVTLTQSIIIDSPGSGLSILNSNATTTGAVTLTKGTLDLTSLTLTCQIFNSTNTNTRAIAFGTGSIVISAGASGAVFDMSTATGFSYSGTSNVVLNGGLGGDKSFYFGRLAGGTESNALSFAFNGTSNAGGYGVCKNLDLSACTAGANWTNNTLTVYGNLTFGSVVTVNTSLIDMTFAATSGTQTITTNGVTVNFPVVQNNPGATVQLGSSFTSGNTYTLTAGTLSANNYNVTIPSLSSSGSNTRSIVMGSETWTISGSGTAWDCSTSTNLSVTPGTSKISMTSASTKTFAGGGKSWGILNQGGAGTLTISGTNTFADIQASSLPSTITFPASGTTTVSAFTAKGTAGNLLTLQSSSAGTQFNISKSSGVVVADYLSLKDSSATGGAQWRAGLNSTIVSNVSGWLLLGPPTQIRASINSSGVLYVPNFNQLDEVSKSINSVDNNALYSNLFDETQTLTFTPPNQSVPGSLALANTKPTSTTSNNYIETANSTSFAINSTQDFTIEAWVKFNSYPVGSETQTIFQIWPRSGSGTYFNYTGWALNLYGPNYTNPPQIYFINFGGGGSSTGFSPTLNTWHHLAYTRQNGNLYYFINGSFQNPTIVDTNAITSAIIKVGKDLNFDGNITNLRLTIGNALYTSSFTPSTVPLTKQANTALLLTMNSNNPFGDSSNNIISVSAPNANVAFSTNSPFTFTPATVPVVQRKTADGNLLVSGYFDETTLS